MALSPGPAPCAADPPSGRVPLKQRVERIARGEDSSQAGGAALLQYAVETPLEEFFEDMPDLMETVRDQLAKAHCSRPVRTYQDIMQAIEALMASGNTAGRDAAEKILFSVACVFSNVECIERSTK